MEPSQTTMPEIYIGCPVTVWADPCRTDPTMGYVLKMKQRFADILCLYNGGVYVRYNCPHVSDPGIPGHPQWFNDPDNPRGIFDLTDTEKRQRQVLTELAAVREFLQTIIERLNRLEQNGRADHLKKQ